MIRSMGNGNTFPIYVIVDAGPVRHIRFEEQ